jgi:hypothetical protein
MRLLRIVIARLHARQGPHVLKLFAGCYGADNALNLKPKGLSLPFFNFDRLFIKNNFMKFIISTLFLQFMLLLQHNKLLCQNKIIIPVKPYPGYNFRTGANLNGKFINDRGQFVFEKQKYSQFKIWDFPLEGNMSEKFILNEYTGELKSLKNESLKVLAAIDNKNQLNLIVDINFDNNFSNDTVLVYKYINYTRKEDLDNGIENFPYSKFIFYTKSREENINYFQLQPLAFYKKNITGWDYSVYLIRSIMPVILNLKKVDTL